MRAVYTYWATPTDINKVNLGFGSSDDLAVTMAYSLEKVREQFCIHEVQLVCNEYGKRLLVDTYKLSFDIVTVALNELDTRLDSNLWAFAKIYAYNLQEKPFIHIDNDLILFDQISEAVYSSDMFFQNREEVSGGYEHNLREAKYFLPDVIKRGELAKNALNCGIVGANNLSIVKEWFGLVEDFIFNPENARYWANITDFHSQNHLFEQYFISKLIEERGLSQLTGFLLPNFDWSLIDDPRQMNPPFHVVHLWGASKQNRRYMDAIKKRLLTEYPSVAELVIPTYESHTEAFKKVYETRLWGELSGGGSALNVTGTYRQTLQRFFQEKAIKSVVDLGCGYFEPNDPIDWTVIEYTGIDCVSSVIEHNVANFGQPNRHFITGDVISMDLPKADVLIIKDVFIHWKNKEIIAFLNRDLPFKYIISTNDSHGVVNVDIQKAGHFHSLDLSKSPFNQDVELLLDWTEQEKKTVVIDRQKELG